MKRVNSRAIYILVFSLILSLVLNAILIIKPESFGIFFGRMFFNNDRHILNDISESVYDSLIVSAGLKMMSSKILITPRSNKENIKLKLGLLDEKLRYNYHHAFLIDGLLSYATATKNHKIISQVNLHLKTLIDKNGKPSKLINFTVLDQATFGLSALSMFKLTNDNRYKFFSDSIYRFLKIKDGPDGILYRDKQLKNITDPNQISDALAMTVPFLYSYGKQFHVKAAVDLANKQISLFRNYAIDKETGIPSHGYNLSTKIKTGSANWGRGIGWYAVAISYIEKDTTKLTDLFVKSLNKLKLPGGGYSQFPGDPSDEDKIDASSTLLIYYFLTKKGIETDYKNVVKKITNENGWIDCSSGEAGGLNLYSGIEGYSELTQGFMLKIISLKYRNIY